MRIGDRIKARRKQLGLSVDDVAEKLGKNRATVYRYESSEIEKLPTTVLEPLARVLRVTPGYLMGWTDESIATHEFLKSITDPDHTSKQVKEQDRSIDKIISSSKQYTPNSMVPVPVVGNVAAGYTCLAETDIVGYELVDSDTILEGYEYMWLRVKGDSMEPMILEGDLVLIRVQPSVESGDYGVVIVDEEDGLVKRIEIDKNKITLISFNPYYPPREFINGDTRRVRIVGKVIESKRKF